MSIPRILVTGADGQLGRSIERLSHDMPAEFVFASKPDLDIVNEFDVNQYFASDQFDVCINTAAYTKVDLAEKEVSFARMINAKAPGILAKACHAQGGMFIHVSTDYVYHNALRRPLKEDDPVSPQSVYASTKLEGERNAMSNNPESIILRTSWLFSEYGNNFVKTMVRLISEGKPLRIVNDQTGCPTYASDLAAAILRIAGILLSRDDRSVFGIYNYCNEGATTWYDFVVAIAGMMHATADIRPISSHEYGAPAVRPAYSVLDTTRIKNRFGVQTPHWQAGLRTVLSTILQTDSRPAE